MPKKYAQIAVALPLESLFTYRIPEDMADIVEVGKRVIVPFGKRKVTGYVMELTSECSLKEVKDLFNVLDSRPLLSEAQIKLISWASRYYRTPLGECIKAALPPGINQASKLTAMIEPEGKSAIDSGKAKGIKAQVLKLIQDGKPRGATEIFKKISRKQNYGSLYQMSRDGWVKLETRLVPPKVAAKKERWAVFAPSETAGESIARLRDGTKTQLICNFLKENTEIPVSELNSRFPQNSYAVKRLCDLKIIRIEKRAAWRNPFADLPVERDVPPELTDDQARALTEIEKGFKKGFASYGLFGVTGSGKTEIYLRLIERVIANGGSAICLVPEISLTPLLVQRFRARFGDRLAVIHSGLNEGERFDQWRRIFTSAADIVIGARSAIFAPCSDLRLIVIDEEHESSYKQDDKFCYNARDLALMRGKIENCPVILGSATPSLETFHNFTLGKHERLDLPKRVASRPLPKVELVDMRQTPDPDCIISPELHDNLAKNLEAGQQSLVLLNRRGYSSFLICPHCGYTFKCRNCSVSLTLHRERSRLDCHYCDYNEPIPDFCPECRGYSIRAVGVGTEQLEDELKKQFPEAAIARMDRDTTSGFMSYQNIFSRLYKGEIEVLIGTQMIAKGHDFPGVTLVGVVGADLSLYLPDFRAAERTFQLLTQVAGRAGRGDMPGRVIIQSYFPEHYALQFAVEHDSAGFIGKEMEFRRELNYPPFTRLVHIQLSGTNEHKVEQAAARLVLAGRHAVSRMLLDKHVTILGPAIPMIPRIHGRHRRQIFIKATRFQTVDRFLNAIKPDSSNPPSGVRVRIDIDPYNIL
jgi:primosomal protein N' (replication factor Y)